MWRGKVFRRLRFKVKIKQENYLLLQYGEYKHHIDSDVLVSHGLYEYARSHLRKLRICEYNNNNYYIKFMGVYYAIPRDYFLMIGKDGDEN